jgi:hypothetical protein
MNTIRADIHSDRDEFTYARRLLTEGTAAQDDKLIFTRDGKDAISATVGWWANRTIRETSTEGPMVVRWRPFPDVRRRALQAKSSGLEG